VRSTLEPEAEPARDPRARLVVLRDILVSPGRAYAAILETRSWLPAYLLVVASGLAGLALSAEALTHVALLTQHADPSSHLGPHEVKTATQTFLTNSALFEVVQPLLAWGVTAMAFSSVARFKGHTIPYRAFFALAAVCSLPEALGNLLDGIGIRLHGATAFPSLKALAVAVPDNLAVFASPGNDREVVFLSSFGIFEIWSAVLLAYGFVAFAKVRPVTALAVAFALDIFFSLIFNNP